MTPPRLPQPALLRLWLSRARLRHSLRPPRRFRLLHIHLRLCLRPLRPLFPCRRTRPRLRLRPLRPLFPRRPTRLRLHPHPPRLPFPRRPTLPRRSLSIRRHPCRQILRRPHLYPPTRPRRNLRLYLPTRRYRNPRPRRFLSARLPQSLPPHSFPPRRSRQQGSCLPST